ncbi:hypothetical protein II906_10070 [bacterium]|nr:hypothetical protein [bacterium]
MTFDEIHERNKKILEYSENGMTLDEIASKVGLSRLRVQSIIKGLGGTYYKESRILKSDNAVKIIELLKSGVKQNDIAKKLGVSRQYVSQVKFKFQSK